MRLRHTTSSAQTDKGQEKKEAQNILCDQNVPEILEETDHLSSRLLTRLWNVPSVAEKCLGKIKKKNLCRTGHHHNLLGNCSSCSAMEKIRWLEFRKKFVGNALYGLALDGCAVAVQVGVLCNEKWCLFCILLFKTLCDIAKGKHKSDRRGKVPPVKYNASVEQ